MNVFNAVLVLYHECLIWYVQKERFAVRKSTHIFYQVYIDIMRLDEDGSRSRFLVAHLFFYQIDAIYLLSYLKYSKPFSFSPFFLVSEDTE